MQQVEFERGSQIDDSMFSCSILFKSYQGQIGYRCSQSRLQVEGQLILFATSGAD